MNYYLLLLVTVLQVPTVNGFVDNECQHCPDGWITFRGSCYYISDNTSVDWTEATHHCTSLHNSHLVIIETKAEDLFLKTEIERMYRKAVDRPGQEFWIGLDDITIEGIWEWYNNVPLGYTNWYPGQPGSDGTDEDCTVIASRSNVFNGWHDAPCSRLHHPICELSEAGTDGTVDVIG